MYLIYLIAKVFPVIAFMSAIVCLDLGRHFRRRKNKKQWAFFGAASVLLLMALVWVGFRGDINSVKWVQSLFIFQ